MVNTYHYLHYSAKTLKKPISTSVWSAQHPNAGQNIQQTGVDAVHDKLPTEGLYHEEL